MTFFIGISGGSSSGKTTLANYLVNEFGSQYCSVIAISNYRENNDESLDLDHPSSINSTKLSKDLDSLKAGKEIAVSTGNRTQSIDIIEPKSIIILEGNLLLAFESIRNRMDYLIYRDCPEEIRNRRAADKSEARLQTDQQNSSIMHDLFIEPFKHKADYITLHQDNLNEVATRIALVVKSSTLDKAEDLASLDS